MKRRYTILSLCISTLSVNISYAQIARQQAAYQNPKLSIDARVKDLLQRMTLEEKIAQMRHIHSEHFDKSQRVDFAKLNSNNTHLSYGCVENLSLSSVGYAKAIYHLQRFMRDSTRLGIPVIPEIEGLHGVVQDGATIYPQSIALASTFNPQLVTGMTDQIGSLVNRMGVKQVLSPVLDLARELRWGRVEETYGEDPFLVGEMATAYVKGLRKHNIICTPKHFVGHGSPLGGINLGSVEGGTRQLFNLYLPPFAKVIKEANPLSIMNCYSSYDGEPVAGSFYLLTDVLRKKLGFKGYVYSDWGSISMLYYFHKTASGPEDAARQAVMAGIDLEAGGNDYKLLEDMVKNGTIQQRYIDSAVSHILYAKFAAGLFEAPLPDTAQVEPYTHTRQSVQLAKQLADESAVLLKNNGVLPLQLVKIKSLAVIGPNADRVQFGDYTWSRNNKDGVTPLKGIKDLAGDQIKVNYAQGCDLVSQDKSGFKAAADAAQASDATVVFVGSQSASLSRDYKDASSGEGFDLSDLKLPGVQEELVEALKATGKPLIVVLVTGKPFAISWIKTNADAIITQFYAGEQEGNAIADILFGKVNPSGKLPVSFPQDVGHLPVYYNHLPSDRGFYKQPGSIDKPGRDYVFSTPDALWSFGYGLSYTSFTYSDFQVSKENYATKDTIQVKLKVANTGSMAGKEVVQLYVNDKVSSIETPVEQLKAFSKVSLQPNEAKQVVLKIPVTDLAIYSRDGHPMVEDGEFELRIGIGADSIRWKKTVVVEKLSVKKSTPVLNKATDNKSRRKKTSL
ncbi:beta-glucosidase [Mucilaginibacter yixingensis]|uniref:Beta-glucosidase n=1 Tax=Mucilaginibacter yixingensis TaxID=1295612 RepID=A0A2T5J987_9SPHI|nr:glycoside hydrolase family 3 N-terminal domain-containing protein [Mucilaginibacter yixingensis]PTQ96641.1 beta-glucosidase [Mucilaginibacter yixingensis]